MPATASLPVPTTVSIFCSATAGAAATADADAAAGAGARSQPDTAKVRVRPITQEESSCFMSFFRGACKKGSHSAALLQFWSGRRVSNSRPQPWQGCALPTELLPRGAFFGGEDRSRTDLDGFAGRCITALLPRQMKLCTQNRSGLRAAIRNSGAGEESRTLDLNLGKVALYQLSYSRIGVLQLTLLRLPVPQKPGAGEESRTLDLNLSKVALYQLSYSRIGVQHHSSKLPVFPVLPVTASSTLTPKNWSGRRVSNSRPQPWQGCALPTELLPHCRQQASIIEDTDWLSRACAEWRVPSHRAALFLDHWPGQAQIIKHRPHRQQASHQQQTLAPYLRVDGAEQDVMEQQQGDGHHLRRGLDLAQRADGHRFGRADLRHPFAQRRDGDLAADDDEGQDGIAAVQLHQHQQGAGHHQLVGHRIEEGAEGRGLVPAPRQKAIEPVGDGGDDEHQRRRHVAVGDRQPRRRQIINADHQRYQRHA